MAEGAGVAAGSDDAIGTDATGGAASTAGLTKPATDGDGEGAGSMLADPGGWRGVEGARSQAVRARASASEDETGRARVRLCIAPLF
jgi:hypothetical protein